MSVISLYVGMFRAGEISISVGNVLQKLKIASVSWKYPTDPSFFRGSYLLNYEIMKANLCFLALQLCPRFHLRGFVHSNVKF